MDKKYVIGIIAATIILVVGFAVLAARNATPARADLGPFTQCIKDRGAIFYGAWWCPHCAETKKLFGTAKNDLPYVECSTPDGNNQLPVCTEKGIESYPTWIFADGSKETGELSLEFISEKTGCALPETSPSPSMNASSSPSVSPSVSVKASPKVPPSPSKAASPSATPRR